MTAAQIIPSTSGKFQKVYAGSINSDNDIVNPATEDKQDDIIDAIGGNLMVQGRHLTSTSNSTTTPLAGDGVYTGTGEIIAAYQATHISIVTDVDSAVNGLEIQYSQDNTNWDNVETHTVIGGKPEQIVSPHNGLYFRLKFTNGSVAQSYLRVQVMHHGMPIGNKLERIDGDIQDNHMVQSVRALLAGKGSNGSYYNVETNRDNSIKTSVVERDVFENLITTSRENQVSVNFFEDTPENLVTVTTSSTGTATASGGLALFSTGTGTTAFAKGVTTQSTRYLGFEVYSMFTAAFTTPTNADSYQRIGIYDTTNGFFIGFEGTSFGATHRNNTSDEIIAQASFSEDLLDGGVSSKFTSNGSPVVLDKTKLNIYRVRFAWLGGGPVFFDVLSPDGNWVTFHKIRYPNTSALASLTSPNLPITADVSKTSSDATDLIIRSGCWTAGSTSNLEDLAATITDSSLAQKVRAVLSAKKPNGTYANISSTTGGNLKVSVEEFESQVVEQISLYPVGTGSNGSVTLTSADTAYSIPATPPTASYVMNGVNNSGYDIYIGYANSNSNGTLIKDGQPFEAALGASQSLYTYTAQAGISVSYTTKEIN